MKVQVNLPQKDPRWKDLSIGAAVVMQRFPKRVYVKMNKLTMPRDGKIGFGEPHGNAMVFEDGALWGRIEWVEEGAKVLKVELEIRGKEKTMNCKLLTANGFDGFAPIVKEVKEVQRIQNRHGQEYVVAEGVGGVLHLVYAKVFDEKLPSIPSSEFSACVEKFDKMKQKPKLPE